MIRRLFASIIAKMQEVRAWLKEIPYRSQVNPKVFFGMQVFFGLFLLYPGIGMSFIIPLLGIAMMTLHFSLVWGYVFVLGNPPRDVKCLIGAVVAIIVLFENWRVGSITTAIVFVATVSLISIARYLYRQGWIQRTWNWIKLKGERYEIDPRLFGILYCTGCIILYIGVYLLVWVNVVLGLVVITLAYPENVYVYGWGRIDWKLNAVMAVRSAISGFLLSSLIGWQMVLVAYTMVVLLVLAVRIIVKGTSR